MKRQRAKSMGQRAWSMGRTTLIAALVLAVLAGAAWAELSPEKVKELQAAFKAADSLDAQGHHTVFATTFLDVRVTTPDGKHGSTPVVAGYVMSRARETRGTTSIFYVLAGRYRPVDMSIEAGATVLGPAIAGEPTRPNALLRPAGRACDMKIVVVNEMRADAPVVTAGVEQLNDGTGRFLGVKILKEFASTYALLRVEVSPPSVPLSADVIQAVNDRIAQAPNVRSHFGFYLRSTTDEPGVICSSQGFSVDTTSWPDWPAPAQAAAK